MSGSEWDITGIIPKANPYVDNPVGTERISPQGPFSQFIDYGSGQMTPQGQQAINTIAPLALGMDATIKAYHGSPYSFDQFDTSKIGTGEGAQAYGHGLYFAENPGVAQQYAKGVIDKDWFKATNKRLSSLAREMDQYRAGEYGKFNDPRGYALQNEYNQLMDERANKIGNTYQVNLNVEPDQLLDWDKPLSEQSQHVQKAIKPYMDQYYQGVQQSYASPQTGWGDLATIEKPPTREQIESKMTGADFYHEMIRTSNSSPGTTSALQNAGIPGIRYLDQGSRSAGEGTHNVVMFNPKQIDITHVNGQPLPDKALKALKESQVTTFGNGQKWALYNGQPVRIA